MLPDLTWNWVSLAHIHHSATFDTFPFLFITKSFGPQAMWNQKDKKGKKSSRNISVTTDQSGVFSQQIWFWRWNGKAPNPFKADISVLHSNCTICAHIFFCHPIRFPSSRLDIIYIICDNLFIICHIYHLCSRRCWKNQIWTITIYIACLLIWNSKRPKNSTNERKLKNRQRKR